MASEHEILLYAEEETVAARIAQLAISEVLRIEAKFSRYRDDSVISAINAAAGTAAVNVDEETAALLDYGAMCHAKSEGLFDLTSGVLRRCWNFRQARLPEAPALGDVLRLIGWEKVHWERPSLFLPLKGMELDFGGIGKEYAADRAASICLEERMTAGLINLGGDVRVLGPMPDGAPWHIGIAHPRAPNAVMAKIELASGALATSGDYERYFELAGRRYCHILNARTGYPVSALRSVSVAAPLCIVAGSLSTIAMLKEELGEAFLRAQGVPYLIADGAGKVRASALRPIDLAQQ